MQITNRLNLPEPLVNAVRNDPYNRGDADISVTGLIGSPYQRRLASIHKDEVTEDVSDRIFALFGQAVHSILERGRAPGYRMEERLFAEFTLGDERQFRISGAFDVITPDGQLQDWKVTSCAAIRDGPKKDWIAQLNSLSFLCWHNGITVTDLEVIAILRDWSRGKIGLWDGEYPLQPVVRLQIPRWDVLDTDGYIADRLALHFDSDPSPCTPEERWHQPDKWAVTKIGAKRALKLHDSHEAAQAQIAVHPHSETLRVVFRQGEDTRCGNYCPVAPYCEAKTKNGH